MQGGYRENAGRKKGFSAIEAEKAREIIVRKVNESLEPILDILIIEAKKGNTRAIRELFDRAYGKSLQSVEMSEEVTSKVIVLNV
jgi:hypothetical protein